MRQGARALIGVVVLHGVSHDLPLPQLHMCASLLVLDIVAMTGGCVLTSLLDDYIYTSLITQ